jgi:hypothetical protein
LYGRYTADSRNSHRALAPPRRASHKNLSFFYHEVNFGCRKRLAFFGSIGFCPEAKDDLVQYNIIHGSNARACIQRLRHLADEHAMMPDQFDDPIELPPENRTVTEATI